MPELPEVETIRKGLNKFILKQKIYKVEVFCEKSFIGEFTPGVVTNMRRFGKALVIDLDNGKSLMMHLRMTGQLIFDERTERPLEGDSARERFAAGHPSENFTAKLPNKQTRVVIYFENGALYFNDQRKFGFIKVMPTVEVEEDNFIKRLAPEPWKITVDDFFEKLRRRKKSPIKAVILDQSVISGLGNIYADEALFLAKIHPLTRAGEITKKEAAELIEAAKTVMEKSIESGGSTMQTYVKADGTKGDYLEMFAQVFRREGKKCSRCGSTIQKIRVAERGTHICPNCQKEVK